MTTLLPTALLHFTVLGSFWLHCCQPHCCTSLYWVPSDYIVANCIVADCIVARHRIPSPLTALLHCTPSRAHVAQITRSSANFLFVAPSNGWSDGLELIKTHQKLAAPAQRTHQRIMTSVIGFSIIHAAPAGDWIFIISRQFDALIFSRCVARTTRVCMSVRLSVCLCVEG